ncbi:MULTISPECIES: hypothetical protein [Corynebacterium]|uniref:hypothetical protein n=1 Tax=Corynebacterium TaxID=1716 RepID=UPI000839D12C|nr:MULTISPECIES: hypothetical protein [Corynebacterium]MBF9011796.1 hypothetical protein [Corynebacterium phoceense]MCQ9345452.1 hypothetical protein [Corynebacterium phoceense]OFN44790.1 hypothetical protein HMPREF2559_07530 [Corynebacterium sp. HMSC072G08]
MKKGIIAITTATVAVLTAGGAAIATGASDTPAMTAGTEDILKPGMEMTFTATCPDNSTRADLTTSFGAHAVLRPAADAGYLMGEITAPEQIGPGPADGYHTYTVTCENGATTTARFADAGNGTAQTARS